MPGSPVNTQRCTRVLPVHISKLGKFVFQDPDLSFLGDWTIHLSEGSVDAANLQEAASRLRSQDVPVAFPTETVYGLGADATRSSAVRGIYNAKQRPSDNPLIVHISSLAQLRNLLSTRDESGSIAGTDRDPIPDIYHPLISRFWPGPLTILLPLPVPSPLAAEVTTSLPTVAVRMPSSRLALALIQIAGTPLAAPSANSSSRPSPTTAAHVLHDLSGRIDLILDGGPCEVGVESTVVDGLANPPVILRPGDVSLDMLRQVTGWEDVTIAYKDGAEEAAPRAPGMKYKHYSPDARVLLFHGDMDANTTRKYLQTARTVGLLTTERWKPEVLQARPRCGDKYGVLSTSGRVSRDNESRSQVKETADASETVVEAIGEPSVESISPVQHSRIHLGGEDEFSIDVWTIALGPDTKSIARGLFSALRELDQKSVEVIFVEGIDDGKGGGARAAIMNRLRKAAELEIIL